MLVGGFPSLHRHFISTTTYVMGCMLFPAEDGGGGAIGDIRCDFFTLENMPVSQILCFGSHLEVFLETVATLHGRG